MLCNLKHQSAVSPMGRDGAWKQDMDDAKEQQLSLETENSEKEAEELKKNVEELERDTENARIAMEEAEKKAPAAVREAKDAGVAEKIAIDEIRILSERTNVVRASNSSANCQIKLSAEQYESFSRKAEESNNFVEMKLAAVKAHLEAINASQNEADKILKTNLFEIEHMKSATEAALKQPEMADTVKKQWRVNSGGGVDKKKNKEVKVAS